MRVFDRFILDIYRALGGVSFVKCFGKGVLKVQPISVLGLLIVVLVGLVIMS